MKYRDVIKLLEADGWQLGTVTVSAGGKLGRDVPPGTLNSIKRQAGLR
jgi:predicted RNA binding protein YcfA (HicA-like mRNA interferase family)